MIFHTLSFQIHGGADHDQGGVAETLASLLTFLEGWVAGTPSEVVPSLFPGIAAMDNLHPMLVHFPIAFLPAFLIIDLAGTWFKKTEWRVVASWLLYMGAISTVVTVISGFIAGNSVMHGDNVHDIMETLELYGIVTLVLVFVLSIWRWIGGSRMRGGANVLFLIVAAVLCAIMLLAADLGGLLVYKYGIGVESIPDQIEIQEHEHHPHSQEESISEQMELKEHADQPHGHDESAPDRIEDHADQPHSHEE